MNGFTVGRAIGGEIDLLEKNHQVAGVPGDEHFVEGVAVNVLAHAQEVGAFEFVAQTIVLEIETLAKTNERLFTFREDEEKIAAGLNLLVHGTLPIGAFNTYGL